MKKWAICETCFGRNRLLSCSGPLCNLRQQVIYVDLNAADLTHKSAHRREAVGRSEVIPYLISCCQLLSQRAVRLIKGATTCIQTLVQPVCLQIFDILNSSRRMLRTYLQSAAAAAAQGSGCFHFASERSLLTGQSCTDASARHKMPEQQWVLTSIGSC